MSQLGNSDNGGGREAERFVKIAILENELEARLLGAALASAGIPHAMTSYYDSAFDGVFQAQRGWGLVAAPARCREAVMALLAELRGGDRAPGDEAAGEEEAG